MRNGIRVTRLPFRITFQYDARQGSRCAISSTDIDHSTVEVIVTADQESYRQPKLL
jgi:hypothetical protein